MDNLQEGRRTEERLNLACLVLVEGPGGIFYCIARNISAGGIFLETEQPLPLGSLLRVTIESPDGGTSFVATGEVKHAVRFAYGDPNQTQRSLRGVGVRFLNFELGTVSPNAMLC